jgi:hypothetical protein
MAIDIINERLIDAKAYAKLRGPGRNGKLMHVSTFNRHTRRGVRGFILESVSFGGNTYTSIEAVQRFVTRLTSARAASGSGGPPPVTPRANDDRVARGLEGHGFTPRDSRRTEIHDPADDST